MTRRKYTGASKMYSLAVNVDAGQVELFELWFKNDLADGSKTFTWAHWRDGAGKTFKFAPEDPYRLEPAEGDSTFDRLFMNVIELPG